MAPVSSAVFLSIISYCACSGTLLLLNKVAIFELGGAPSLVSFIQVAFTSGFLLLAKVFNWLTLDDFEPHKIKPYLYYVAAFVLTIVCNMKALEASNVDTVIVFRSCTPLAVAVLDWVFLGRELPGLRSSLSLLLILAGAFGYVSSDAQFAVNGVGAYGWVSAYFVGICLEMTYGKAVLSSVKMKTVGGSVLYTNVFGAPPMLLISWATGELTRAGELNWSGKTMGLLGLACVVGTGISYAGWWCRGLVSATSYTVIGVANKIVTVLLNVLVWNKHASPLGMTFLLVCLAGGAIYRQAPMRADAAAAVVRSSGAGGGSRQRLQMEGVELLAAEDALDGEDGSGGSPLRSSAQRNGT